jgi:cysteinyl-tRNA synthetase, unknown class
VTHDRPDPPATRSGRLAALRRVRSWAPVIGADALPALDAPDLVVVDGLPEARGDDGGARARLAAARATGALVIAYLSVGTVEDWRAYASEVAPGWTLGPVPGWEGERFVDARASGWRRIMAREAAGLQERGFDGIFLDNLDVAEDHPATQDALVELVVGIRAAAAEALLVAQNGLTTIDRLPVDAVAREDTWWRWGDDRYERSPPQETAAILDDLRRQRARGLVVLTLDYTEPGDPAAGAIVACSRAEGFVPAVSVLALDRAPHAPARSGRA